MARLSPPLSNAGYELAAAADDMLDKLLSRLSITEAAGTISRQVPCRAPERSSTPSRQLQKTRTNSRNTQSEQSGNTEFQHLLSVQQWGVIQQQQQQQQQKDGRSVPTWRGTATISQLGLEQTVPPAVQGMPPLAVLGSTASTITFINSSSHGRLSRNSSSSRCSNSSNSQLPDKTAAQEQNAMQGNTSATAGSGDSDSNQATLACASPVSNTRHSNQNPTTQHLPVSGYCDSNSSSNLSRHSSGSYKQQGSKSIAWPAACSQSAAYSTVADADVAVWLPEQHPAVVAVLKQDLCRKNACKLQPSCSSLGNEVARQPIVGDPADSQQAASPAQLQVLVPQFPATAPTIVFRACAESSILQECSSHEQQQQLGQQQLQVLPLQLVNVYVRYCGLANKTVKQVFRSSGLKRTKGYGWSVLWGSLAPPELLQGLTPTQKHNHFPGTWELGRKDRLYRNVAAAARRTRGKAFSFVPRFFIMPFDADDFRADLIQNPNGVYIRKPAASSRGRGVRVVKDPHVLNLTALEDVILQRYIPDPLLIGGRKLDLRVYVAVTSLDPLRVYVYHEGLVRFASEQYSGDKSSFGHATMHLTNYSVNKAAAGFKQPGGSKNKSPAGSPARRPAQQQQQQQARVQPRQQGQLQQPQNMQLDSCDEPAATAPGDAALAGEEDDGGSDTDDSDDWATKWSFERLARYLQSQGHSWQHVWQQVCQIAVQTIIAAEPGISALTRSAGLQRNSNCFEVFGFDIMLDSKLRAWLIEVNTSPSLSADSTLDINIKTNMVADLLSLVGVTPSNRAEYQQAEAADRQARLTGLGRNTGSSAAGNSVGSLHNSPNRRSSSAGSKPPGSSRAGSVRLMTQNSKNKSAPSHRQTGSGAMSAGAAAAAAAAAVRTVKDVEHLDLLAVPPCQLPGVIRESEAEYRRCCLLQKRWQLIFPDPEQPQRYIDLFDAPRVNNALVARYRQLVAKAAKLTVGLVQHGR